MPSLGLLASLVVFPSCPLFLWLTYGIWQCFRPCPCSLRLCRVRSVVFVLSVSAVFASCRAVHGQLFCSCCLAVSVSGLFSDVFFSYVCRPRLFRLSAFLVWRLCSRGSVSQSCLFRVPDLPIRCPLSCSCGVLFCFFSQSVLCPLRVSLLVVSGLCAVVLVFLSRLFAVSLAAGAVSAEAWHEITSARHGQ